MAVTKFAVTAVPVTLPERKPVNWVLAVTKLAVTAVPETLPETLPERNPVNCVLAVTKLAVTAVPVTLPERKPVNWVLAVIKFAVTAVPETLPLTAGTVRTLVEELKLISASVNIDKPIEEPAFVLTNVGYNVPVVC